jgi:hypothetical protein
MPYTKEIKKPDNWDELVYVDGGWDAVVKSHKMFNNILTDEDIEKIRKNPELVDWVDISSHYFCSLTEDFMREFKDYLHWECISGNQILSENFIEEMMDCVDMKQISCSQDLSEKFIAKHKNELCWILIVSRNRNLSEDFIKKYSVYMDWHALCYNQQLSENFIREIEHEIGKGCWVDIFLCQKLSKKFKKEFSYKLDEFVKDFEPKYENFLKDVEEFNKKPEYTIEEQKKMVNRENSLTIEIEQYTTLKQIGLENLKK